MKDFKEFNSKLEFAQDTINYYWGDSNRRCIDENGDCRYTAVSQHTDGCAIGRHLSDELCKELDNVVSVSVEYAIDKLPEWMQKLEVGFLSTVQRLHDARNFTDMDKDTVKQSLKDYIDVTQLTFPS